MISLSDIFSLSFLRVWNLFYNLSLFFNRVSSMLCHYFIVGYFLRYNDFLIDLLILNCRGYNILLN